MKFEPETAAWLACNLILFSESVPELLDRKGIFNLRTTCVEFEDESIEFFQCATTWHELCSAAIDLPEAFAEYPRFTILTTIN